MLADMSREKEMETKQREQTNPWRETDTDKEIFATLSAVYEAFPISVLRQFKHMNSTNHFKWWKTMKKNILTWFRNVK